MLFWFNFFGFLAKKGSLNEQKIVKKCAVFLLLVLACVFSVDVTFTNDVFEFPKQNSTYNYTLFVKLSDAFPAPNPQDITIRCSEDKNDEGGSITSTTAYYANKYLFIDNSEINKALSDRFFAPKPNIEDWFTICQSKRIDILFYVNATDAYGLQVVREIPKLENLLPFYLFNVGMFILCLVSAILLRPVVFLNKIASMFYFFLFIVLLLLILLIFDTYEYLQGLKALDTITLNFYNTNIAVFIILLLLMFWVFVLWHFSDIMNWFRDFQNKFF